MILALKDGLWGHSGLYRCGFSLRYKNDSKCMAISAIIAGEVIFGGAILTFRHGGLIHHAGVYKYIAALKQSGVSTLAHDTFEKSFEGASP